MKCGIKTQIYSRGLARSSWNSLVSPQSRNCVTGLCVCVLHTFQCFICSSFVGHLYIIDYAKAVFYCLHQHRINIRFTTRWRCCLYVCLLYIFYFPSYFSFPPFPYLYPTGQPILRTPISSLRSRTRNGWQQVALFTISPVSFICPTNSTHDVITHEMTSSLPRWRVPCNVTTGG